jgi:AcrR family transcriptional regulator
MLYKIEVILMANVKNNFASKATQRRLLDAAGEVFALRGFHSATMKEITERAQASLASINYHFSDKAELYAAVFRELEGQILSECSSLIIPTDLDADPKQRLTFFITTFMHRILGSQHPAWQRMLIGKEFLQPSGMFDSFIRTVIRPMNANVESIVAELMGLEKSDMKVALVAASILAQCLYYHHQGAYLEKIHTQFTQFPDVAQIATHIAEFSLAAIETKFGSPKTGST